MTGVTASTPCAAARRRDGAGRDPVVAGCWSSGWSATAVTAAAQWRRGPGVRDEGPDRLAVHAQRRRQAGRGGGRRRPRRHVRRRQRQLADHRHQERREPGGPIALTTALWWKRTGDDSYLEPLKKFILDSPKNYDPAVQSLFEMRAYGGLFAAVNILSASGEWSSTARLPHYDDVTWDEFMNGGGDSFKKKLPMRTLSGVGRQQWRTIRGASVDSASNWGGVARFAYLMWAVCEKDHAAIEENAQLLRKWLGSTGTGEADFNTTAAYLELLEQLGRPGRTRRQPAEAGLRGREVRPGPARPRRRGHRGRRPRRHGVRRPAASTSARPVRASPTRWRTRTPSGPPPACWRTSATTPGRGDKVVTP